MKHETKQKLQIRERRIFSEDVKKSIKEKIREKNIIKAFN